MKNSEKFKMKKGLLVLAFTNFCLWTTLMAVFPIVPVIVKDLQANSSQVGGILGLASLLMVVLNIPAGVFSDRHGRKPYILVGLFILMISSLGVVFATSATFFYITWLIGGIGRGLFLSPAFAVVGDVYQPHERGKAMGILSASIGLGSVAGYVLGGVIGGIINWKVLFMIITAINLLGFILAFFLVETSPKAKERTVQNAFVNTFALFKNTNISLLNIITLLGFGAAVSVTFLIPFVAQKVNISISSLALFFIPYEIFAVIGAISIGKIADRAGRKNPLIGLLVLTTLSALGLSYLGVSYFPILIFYAIIAFCEGPLIALTGTMVTDIIVRKDPRQIGSALGSFRTVYSLGAVLGPWFGGLLSESSNVLGGFKIISAVLAFCVILSFFTKETLIKEDAKLVPA